jgi:hypothetical protein
MAKFFSALHKKSHENETINMSKLLNIEFSNSIYFF